MSMIWMHRAIQSQHTTACLSPPHVQQGQRVVRTRQCWPRPYATCKYGKDNCADDLLTAIYRRRGPGIRRAASKRCWSEERRARISWTRLDGAVICNDELFTDNTVGKIKVGCRCGHHCYVINNIAAHSCLSGYTHDSNNKSGTCRAQSKPSQYIMAPMANNRWASWSTFLPSQLYLSSAYFRQVLMYQGTSLKWQKMQFLLGW